MPHCVQISGSKALPWHPWHMMCMPIIWPSFGDGAWYGTMVVFCASTSTPKFVGLITLVRPWGPSLLVVVLCSSTGLCPASLEMPRASVFDGLLVLSFILLDRGLSQWVLRSVVCFTRCGVFLYHNCQVRLVNQGRKREGKKDSSNAPD